MIQGASFCSQSHSIVAVHGLDGHWKKSWTANNQVFWLEDLLPQVLPNARIYFFSHDSRTRGSKTPLRLDIDDFAKGLISQLVATRNGRRSEASISSSRYYDLTAKR
jgi:hypothetical protein